MAKPKSPGGRRPRTGERGGGDGGRARGTGATAEQGRGAGWYGRAVAGQ